MPDLCSSCSASEPLFSAAQYMRPPELRMCEACVVVALRSRIEALATKKQEKRDALLHSCGELGPLEREFDASSYYTYAEVGHSARDCTPGSACFETTMDSFGLWSEGTTDSDVTTEPAPPPGFKHNSKTRSKMRRSLASCA